MTNGQFSDDEIGRLGEQIYVRDLAPHIDLTANRGKLLSIDIETGAYEIGEDETIDAPLRLHARHPGAVIYTLRIGYNAADTLGGILEPTA